MVYFLLFLFGGIGYGVVEILWRGYTHPTMVVAGGLSLIAVYIININFGEFSIISKALLGALSITLIELIFGVIFNLILKWDIWDYSKQLFNIKGQICPLYSFYWFVLCFLLFPLCSYVQHKIIDINSLF